MRFRFLVAFLLCSWVADAQVVNTATMDTLETTVIGHLGIGGYVDTYYGFNFSQPSSGDNPYFVSSARHKEMAINLAYIDLRYRSNRMRARLVPGFGTYMNANYANEPGTLKNIVEGYLGVNLSQKRNIWLDVGVFGSPYTNESAISKDHLMYTRSFAPEYVPYYLSGAKLSVPLNQKWNANFFLLNGWQVIQDNNEKKSFGAQVEFRPNNSMLFNWNTFAGDERNNQNPEFRTRYLFDFFWIYKPKNSKWDATASTYVGWQQMNTGATRQWWQANVIGRYTINSTVSISGRVEYFHDPQLVFIAPITGVSGFRTYSSGLCLNVKIAENAMFRFEGRQFYSGEAVYFDADDQPAHHSALVIANLTAWF
ncbi:MAG: outer membrane beta-barrel protein [Cyclobacteriaceae bacterium]